MAGEITLGIDFGTSNTVAVLAIGSRLQVVRFEGHSFMPSAIFLQDNGVLAVGRDAERPARLAPERFEPNPKRRIDDIDLLLGVEVVSVQGAISAVLLQVLTTAVAELNGARPTRINLTHPAQWASSRRRLLAEAARRAGLDTVTMIPEPIAAATHYGSLPGRSLPAGSSLAVYDLGGGTFDCAVVEATETGYLVLAEGGLADVGGVDFDQAILEHLGRGMAQVDPAYWQAIAVPQTAADRRASRSLREDVRAAKEALSRYPQTDVPLPDPLPDALLTRGEMEGLIRSAIIRTVTQLQRTIRDSGREPDRLAGIYLVGGSSRIPLVAAIIAERTGIVPVTLEEPETAVALGAAMATGVTTNKDSGVLGPFGAQPGSSSSPSLFGGPTSTGQPMPGSSAPRSSVPGSSSAPLSQPPPPVRPAHSPAPPPPNSPPVSHPESVSPVSPARSVGSSTPSSPSSQSLSGSAGPGDGPITSVPSAAELRAAAASAPRVPAAAPSIPPPARSPEPASGSTDALGDARAGLQRLLGESQPSRSRRTWWIIVLVAAVLIAVVVELIAITGDSTPDSGNGGTPTSTGTAGSGAVESGAAGSIAGPACDGGQPGGASKAKSCLTELSDLAAAGPGHFKTAAAAAPTGTFLARIQQAQPAGILSMTGQDPADGQPLSLQIVQFTDAQHRDALFDEFVGDSSGTPQPHRNGKYPGRYVQGKSAMTDNLPETVFSLDETAVVIILRPTKDDKGATAMTPDTVSSAFFATVLR